MAVPIPGPSTQKPKGPVMSFPFLSKRLGAGMEGYRRETTCAPLKETTPTGILQTSNIHSRKFFGKEV